MIENKIIEITKENDFDRDWAIFTDVEENFKSHVNAQSIQDIVNKITFASQIDFILSDCVFHRRLYEAILWSFNQGGLILNLTYKNDVEIIKLEGRKTYDSTPGNYDPTIDTYTTEELDSNHVELTITAPTGENRQYGVYGAIGIGILIMIGIGIIIIKRKVLKK